MELRPGRCRARSPIESRVERAAAERCRPFPLTRFPARPSRLARRGGDAPRRPSSAVAASRPRPARCSRFFSAFPPLTPAGHAQLGVRACKRPAGATRRARRRGAPGPAACCRPTTSNGCSARSAAASARTITTCGWRCCSAMATSRARRASLAWAPPRSGAVRGAPRAADPRARRFERLAALDPRCAAIPA